MKWNMGVICPKQHHYLIRHPIGKSIDMCPYCEIDEIIKTLRTLKKYLKQVNK